MGRLSGFKSKSNTCIVHSFLHPSVLKEREVHDMKTGK